MSSSERRGFFITSAAYGGIWILWIVLLVRFAAAIPIVSAIGIGVVILILPVAWATDYDTYKLLKASTPDDRTGVATKTLLRHLGQTTALQTILFVVITWMLRRH
jgi:FtsH-binding integral membrane protein